MSDAWWRRGSERVKGQGRGGLRAERGSIVAGRDIANAIALQVEQMVVQAARQPAAWPYQLGSIPQRAGSFRTRGEVAQLRQAAMGREAGCLVLSGAGGVGKTQLAADYARAVQDAGSVDVLLWVPAGSRASVVASYAQAATELLARDWGNAEQAAEAFLAWLEPKSEAAQQESCRWLVVLDGIEDPAEVEGLVPAESRWGRTLITSRRRDAALVHGRKHVPVGLYSEEEGRSYLAAALDSHGRSDDQEELAALAGDLGHLPLALSQAVAYIVDDGIDCADYRRLLADRATRLEELAPDRLPDGQTAAVHAAWSLSIDRADQLRPHGLARPMLYMASLLDPNGIPQDVLTSDMACAYLAGPGGKRAVRHRDASRVLRVLHRLCLIDHDRDTAHREVRIHELIQRAVRDELSVVTSQVAAAAAGAALLTSWPDTAHATALGMVLRSNAAAFVAHAHAIDDMGFAVFKVILRTASSFGQAGHLSTAIDCFQRLAESARPKDHELALNTWYQLAHYRGEAGEVAEAIAILQETLPRMRRVLGPEHRGVLAAGHELARWQAQADNHADALEVSKEILAAAVDAHGPDSPDTITLQLNLALRQGDAGDLRSAVATLEDLAPCAIRAYGAESPTALMIQGYVARFQADAGDMKSARSTFRDLSAEEQLLMGSDNAYVLHARHELAFSRGATGDIKGALRDYDRLLADRTRVLGPDHPDTLLTQYNLLAYQLEVVQAMESTAARLTRSMNVRGSDRQQVSSALHEVMYLRDMVNHDAESVIASVNNVVEHADTVLGSDHPLVRRFRSLQEEAASVDLNHQAAILTGSTEMTLSAAAAQDPKIFLVEIEDKVHRDVERIYGPGIHVVRNFSEEDIADLFKKKG
ncbi:tetratricopeptide repeat protein [Streptomyces sp. NPDC057908]|uniref:tetratricopeptide repeat protein n=1 Tax=Streptomyces sp. NPDC057908 TaxID=3346276 RepID=UPI0036E61229